MTTATVRAASRRRSARSSSGRTGRGASTSPTRRKPGEKFTRTDFTSAAQLSFPASQVAKIAKLDGVDSASGSLTLNAVTIKGTVPKNGFQRPQQGPPGTQPQGGGQTAGRAPFDIDSLSVTGVDESKPELAAVNGFHAGSAREAVLNESYARRNSLSKGDTISLGGKKFTIIGLASSPLGGQASDVYVKLAQLQKLSDRAGPHQQPPGARRLDRRRRGGREVDQGDDERRVGDDGVRPRRPRRRLAQGRQEPVGQARHGADDRRAWWRRS